MLTRLEVDGFKNLLDFSVDFGPYTCIAGPNAIGKSNIFDAIQFLSLLADNTFFEAAADLRNAGSPSADIASLFWQGDLDPRMRFAVEFIVDEHLQDDFGRDARATATYLRYELELGYESDDPLRGAGSDRIVLLWEELRYFTLTEARQKMQWPHSRVDFRDQVIKNRRRGPSYISTTIEDEVRTINIHADGGSRGQTRKSPADRAPRTVVSTTTTSDSPTILAARREMQNWHILALEPSALRRADNLSDPDSMTENGKHMPGTLRRISRKNGVDSLSLVASTASALTDVRSVSVDLDPQRQTLTLRASLHGGPELPARSLSDGTLRFLALAIMANDSAYRGLICMEEPENGIHPARIEEMANLVRDVAVDPEEKLGDENPMRQVIVNTHSPGFVMAQHASDLLFAETATVVRNGTPSLTVKLLPLRQTWRSANAPASLTKRDIGVFLEALPDTQLSLDLGGDF